MSLIVISTELASSNISHPKGTVLDFDDAQTCIEFFKDIKVKEISIYDITRNVQVDHEAILPVNDHVNCTGNNPLVGRQQTLGVDFVDMTNVYKQNNGGVITHSCGGKLNNQFEFPSHYLAHFVILARTFKFKSIVAYLINYKI
tara:strand:- start:4304 stop:4735 length:432 start_codon:yes stop_codon:yes gene_type:complete